MQFNFRCDAPSLRRFLKLRVIPAEMGGVHFETTTVKTELRPTQELFSRYRPRSGDKITACSWCNRIEAETGWHEVEEAVETLGLFDVDPLPMLTHGICPSCYDTVSLR
jgi:hypothetical protein